MFFFYKLWIIFVYSTRSYSYGDELTWAAIWLYKATQDESYATKAKELWDEFGMDYVANNFSWDNKNPGVQVSENCSKS